MPITKLFETRISTGNFVSKSLIQECLKDCYKIRESDKVGMQWSIENYPFGYTSYSSFDRLFELNSSFAQLGQLILARATSYARSLEIQVPRQEPLCLTHLWINIQGKGGFHSGHIHPQSTLSGTVYLQVPKGAGSIRFEDPRLGFFMGGRPRTLSSQKSSVYYSHSPQKAEIVMFESWLRHEVLPNKSHSDRVSLSFNLF
jgi:uncharacterized protein (TIGR02466 family)